MPVGCLGDAGRSAANGGSSLYLSNNKGAAESGGRGAESASRQAERFALMQETLLMQIFRCDQAAQQDGGHNRSQDEAGDTVYACPRPDCLAEFNNYNNLASHAELHRLQSDQQHLQSFGQRMATHRLCANLVIECCNAI